MNSTEITCIKVLYQSVELLLLVPMLFLLAIPKCLRIFTENVYYTGDMCTSLHNHIWRKAKGGWLSVTPCFVYACVCAYT